MKKGCPIFLFLLVFCFQACVDEIELSSPETPRAGMVVQGKFLFGKKGMAKASIFELYNSPNGLPKPVGGAEVVMQDNHGHEITLPSYTNGNYFVEIKENDPNFPVQAGRQYRLVATLPNGQVFQSAWETLPLVSPIDSVHVAFNNQEIINQIGELDTIPFARFSVSASLDAQGADTLARLLWEFDQSYRLTDDPIHPLYVNNPPKTCYIVRELFNDHVVLLDGTLANESYLNEYFLLETPADYRFAEGFYLIFYQQSIGENASGYFSELNQLLAKKGTLFDPPAGEIRSNMTSPTDPELPVHGFFYVAAQDTMRLYISPEMAGNIPRHCPFKPSAASNTVGYEQALPNACDHCLLETGAQLEKPNWWEH